MTYNGLKVNIAKEIVYFKLDKNIYDESNQDTTIFKNHLIL